MSEDPYERHEGEPPYPVAPQRQPPPYGYQFVPPPVRPTSGVVVVGFIASLLWLGGLGSVIAIICSIAAWRQTSSGERGGHGLNIASLVIGILGLVGALFTTLPLLVLMIGALASGSGATG